MIIGWERSPEARDDAARFFARVIAADPSYISHGEIQTALSLDGVTWAPDLEARFLADLRDIDDAHELALARDAGGQIVGAAIAVWSLEQPEAPFVTLADVAVDETARGSGVGRALVAFILAEAEKRGAKWAFLESGKHNHQAHTFFERAGFAPISTVFVKRL